MKTESNLKNKDDFFLWNIVTHTFINPGINRSKINAWWCFNKLNNLHIEDFDIIIHVPFITLNRTCFW